ncbi:DUF503 domain-containing protein [Ketobacter sp.]|uniref:DUF503 domain-containing protein n=1 Tax=Ketobacter sp. TaxID=2083498 RepID=UPI000F2B4D59|nr:DUF503 domain-containing protein [Ketobacter sp.]RLT92499.1 MAG: DUF503 domain-containing protein [Ketobacter sp.]
MNTAYLLYSEFELHIPYSQSLKQKRQVVQRLRDRLRQQFNVSIAEVASQEEWQRAGMALVMVGSSRRQLESQQNALEAFILEVVDAEVQWLSREWI